MRRILTTLVLCASGATAQAQTLPQVQITDADGGVRDLRGAVEAQIWRAVGRLDTGASFCSATLISENLVLTAAHCVFHPQTSRRFAVEELTFLAGLRNGRPEAIRQIRRIMVLPDYRPETGPEIEMIGRDIALLELAQPIASPSIVPIAAARTGWREGEVTVVSYGRDRESSASIEEGCEILARQGSVRSLSCEVVSGASGSPVLRVNQGRAEVVAVMSASAQSDGEEFSLAVILDGHLSTLLDQYQRSGPVPSIGTIGAATSFVGQGDDRRGSIGARFIRP